jgi:hypothetical protein
MSIVENADDANQDIVWGAEAIAAVIRVTQRRAFYLLENGSLPAKKLGGRWVGELSPALPCRSAMVEVQAARCCGGCDTATGEFSAKLLSYAASRGPRFPNML